MNYLAHVYLAQPNTESVCGNLMGDFMKGVNIDTLPAAILRGVYNHRMIDRYTDTHPKVKALKVKLSPSRRRFSGVIADIVFDHLLTRHWDRYSEETLDNFIEKTHQRIYAGRHFMNPRMQQVLMLMIKENWLHSYQTLSGVETILERIARRIRFKNQLSGVMREVEALMEDYNDTFVELFPELQQQVMHQGIETTPGDQ